MTIVVPGIYLKIIDSAPVALLKQLSLASPKSLPPVKTDLFIIKWWLSVSLLVFWPEKISLHILSTFYLPWFL